MTNNEFLRRFRYAIDIPDAVMVKSFKESGYEIDTDGVRNMLKKEDEEGYVKCNNNTLRLFLDGFIIYKRGRQELKPGQKPREPEPLTSNNINNAILKKIKIALNLHSEDMLEIFSCSGTNLSPSELSSLFRKRGHKNYKECLDSYLKNFLKGLTIHHRGENQ